MYYQVESGRTERGTTRWTPVKVPNPIFQYGARRDFFNQADEAIAYAKKMYRASERAASMVHIRGKTWRAVAVYTEGTFAGQRHVIWESP